MNQQYIYIVIRFLFIIALQVFILKRIQFDSEILSYGQVMLYPVLIFLLPLKVQKSVVLIIAFFTGLAIDIFYDSLGVHAASLVFTAYMRNIVMRLISPYEGYKTKDNSSIQDMGFSWVFVYTAILLFIHLFTYFSIEAFSFVYIYDIVMKTIFSFLLSIGILLLYQVIFKSKN